MNFYIVYVDGVNAGYMPASNLWEAQQKAEEAWPGYDVSVSFGVSDTDL